MSNKQKFKDCGCQKWIDEQGYIPSTGGHGSRLPVPCFSCRMVGTHGSHCNDCDGEED